MSKKQIIVNSIPEQAFDNLLKANNANCYNKGYANGCLAGILVGGVATIASFLFVDIIYGMGKKAGKKEAKNTYEAIIDDISDIIDDEEEEDKEES